MQKQQISEFSFTDLLVELKNTYEYLSWLTEYQPERDEGGLESGRYTGFDKLSLTTNLNLGFSK